MSLNTVYFVENWKLKKKKKKLINVHFLNYDSFALMHCLCARNAGQKKKTLKPQLQGANSGKQ